MKPKSLEKQIKLIPIIFLAIIISNLIISLSACYDSIGRTKIIDVSVERLKEKTYRQVDIGGKNNFQTGTDGRLHWKVKNAKEASLIFLANQDGVLNVYDLFYLLILDIALFIMVYGVGKEIVFTKQIVYGLYLIGFSVIFYPFIMLSSYQISSWSIEKLTNGSFTGQLKDINIPKYLYLAYLLFFMVPLVKKGISLQQEQGLTI